MEPGRRETHFYFRLWFKLHYSSWPKGVPTCYSFLSGNVSSIVPFLLHNFLSNRSVNSIWEQLWTIILSCTNLLPQVLCQLHFLVPRLLFCRLLHQTSGLEWRLGGLRSQSPQTTFCIHLGLWKEWMHLHVMSRHFSEIWGRLLTLPHCWWPVFLAPGISPICFSLCSL